MTNRMEWQPIETAPKDGTPILIWDGEIQYVCAWVQRTPGDWRWFEFDGEFYHSYKPTHWMPLPEPPLADHPRPTTPVVDHATRIAELEAEVAKWKAGVELEAKISTGLEAEVERLKGAIDSIIKSADHFASAPLEPGESVSNRLLGVKWIATRARSTAMNKGGE